MTPSEFRAWFPSPSAFASMTDEAITPFIARTVPYFNVARWGDFYSEGVANLTAHFIVMANAQAAAGITVPVASDLVSKSVGGVSGTRHAELVAEAAHDTFMRTSYGQEYCRLRDLVGLGGAVAST
jgi:hypothetical protein